MGSFGRGFIAGLAGSIKQEIDADMESSRERAQRFADLTLEKNLKESERYSREEKENFEKINDMTKSLNGDIDAVQFLIDKHGFSGAQEEVKALKQLQISTNGKITPQKALGLQARGSGQVTSSQLAQYVTTPVKKYDVDGLDSRVGFMKLFQDKETSTASLIKRVEDERAALGITGKTSIEDMPAPVSGRGMYPWLKNLTGNPETDFVNFDERVTDLSLTLAESKADGLDTSSVQEELNFAVEMRDSQKLKAENAQRLKLGLSNMGGPLSAPESRAAGKHFELSIANRFGVREEGDYAAGIYQGTLGKAAQQPHLSEARNIAVEVMNEARKASIEPVYAQTQIERAITLNKIPIVVEQDGNFIIKMSDDDLVDLTLTDSKDKPLFPIAVAAQDSNIDSSTQTQNKAQASINMPDINSAIQTYRESKKTGTDKKVAIGRIMEMINPSTNKNYTEQEALNLVGG
jgi:hypothetical protein